MNAPAALPEVSAALDAELVALRDCVGFLTAEQDALVHGEIDALPRIMAQKAAQLSITEERTRQREALLTRRKLPSTRAGMLALIGGDRTLNEQWKTVLDWAKKASDMNRVNGCLIDARLGANGLALATLHGASAPTSIYGRDGHLRHQSAGRALAIG